MESWKIQKSLLYAFETVMLDNLVLITKEIEIFTLELSWNATTLSQSNC